MLNPKKTKHYLFIGTGIILFLMFASYENGNLKSNLFGAFGHHTSHFLVHKVWGLTAFFFPFAFFFIGYQGLKQKLDINKLLSKLYFGFLFIFSLNLFLLNTPLINTSFSGLFTMVFHAFLINFFGESSKPTLGSLLIESMVLSLSFIYFYKSFSFWFKKMDQKEWVSFVKNKLRQSGKNIKSLSKDMKLDKEQIDPKLLQDFPLIARVRRDDQGIIYPYQTLKTTENSPPQTKVSTEANQTLKDSQALKNDSLDTSDFYLSNISYEHETNSQEAIDIDLSLSKLFSTKKKISLYESETEPVNNPLLNDPSLIVNHQNEQVPKKTDPLEKMPLVLNLFETETHEYALIIKNLKANTNLLVKMQTSVNQNSHKNHLIIKEVSKKLEETIRQFGIDTKVVSVSIGPVITQYELTVEPGVKISKIVNLSDNIALSLAAKSIRIVAPIPGKSVIGIEVPNLNRENVFLRDIVESQHFKQTHFTLPIALGKSLFGKAVITDLRDTPHLLIAGATGSGKSVCVNSIICSLLFKCSPKEVRFLMIDPKMVELNIYNGIPHLLCPVITNPKQASASLRWVLQEMEARYYLLEKYQVRSIHSYNKIIKEKKMFQTDPEQKIGTLPYIVVIIDEFADLMITSKKEVEDHITRLAAMSRAIGIHLILATQRPSVDVITGVIKANFPSRIAFQVPSKIDSRTILDTGGGEKLLGKGDMLFQSVKHYAPERIQGNFLSDEEVHQITSDLKDKTKDYPQSNLIHLPKDNLNEASSVGEVDDVLYEQALKMIQHERKVSASYLQRKLKIGYNRSARLVEMMEERGLIGPADGSKPREIYL